MRIFIGSSTKKKKIAEEVSVALEKAGYDVQRWWNAFRGGDATIDRLIQMSDGCDGAVFIFGADDKILTKTSHGEKRLVATKDNVLLEYGMFVGKTGPKKCIFVRQRDVNIPSDLLGITHLGEKDYVNKIIRGLNEAFGYVSPSKIASQVLIYASRNLLNKVRTETPIPDGWFSRGLYIGSRGANAWTKVEADPGYPGHQDFQGVRNLIEILAKKTALAPSHCIVSFGPGMGLLDGEVLPILSGGKPVEYIAVDINDYLAVHAADSLDRASLNTKAPFCIVADFEDDMSLIADIINERTRPGRIFMMLGGTFGNLERGEDRFLHGLHTCMKEEDIAILDVFTWINGYTVESDSYHDLTGLAESIKCFLSGGVERRLSIPTKKVMESISDYIEFRTGKRTSNIDGTKEFEFCCKKGGHPLIYVRRYDFNEFKKHLERDFHVIAADTTDGDSNKLVRRSVYFLKKRIPRNKVKDKGAH